jgi:hypothetical protein
MTVSGIDPQGSAQAAAPAAPFGNALKSISDLLGMSQDDIRTALKGGSSLSDLAQPKGISSDQLVDTISQALQGIGAPASTDLRAAAQKIADHKGLGHHRHHHAHAAEAPSATPQPVAENGYGTDVYA